MKRHYQKFAFMSPGRVAKKGIISGDEERGTARDAWGVQFWGIENAGVSLLEGCFLRSDLWL